MERRIQAILFDLGGVVIELGGLPLWREWTGEEDDEVVWSRWLHSQAVRRFESGSSEPADFGREIVEEFTLPISPEEFLREFEFWPRGVYAGVPTLLEATRRRVRTACLSNCNALHWPRFLGEMGLRDAFDDHFSSHELGTLKPDREIFERVVARLGLPAADVVLLDDNQINVDGARNAGLAAYRVKGPAELATRLRELGLVEL